MVLYVHQDLNIWQEDIITYAEKVILNKYRSYNLTLKNVNISRNESLFIQ